MLPHSAWAARAPAKARRPRHADPPPRSAHEATPPISAQRLPRSPAQARPLLASVRVRSAHPATRAAGPGFCAPLPLAGRGRRRTPRRSEGALRRHPRRPRVPLPQASPYRRRWPGPAGGAGSGRRPRSRSRPSDPIRRSSSASWIWKPDRGVEVPLPGRRGEGPRRVYLVSRPPKLRPRPSAPGCRKGTPSAGVDRRSELRAERLENALQGEEVRGPRRVVPARATSGPTASAAMHCGSNAGGSRRPTNSPPTTPPASELPLAR